jgi:unsaturated pyranuronate lyase
MLISPSVAACRCQRAGTSEAFPHGRDRRGRGSGRPCTIDSLSAFDDIAAVDPQQIWDGVLGRAVHGERVTLGVIELEPGSVVPEHSHENEQLGLVLRGSLVFSVGGERRALGPGGTWRIPASTPHAVETGPEGAVVIDVFSPIRDDWQGLERLERPPLWPG